MFKNIKKIVKLRLVPIASVLPIFIVLSCHDKSQTAPETTKKDAQTSQEDKNKAIKMGNQEATKTKKTNQTINFHSAPFNIPKKDNVKIRTLLFPAARNENKLDSQGVFRFQLHHSPVKGVTGKWSAYATEVKSLTDNTLVDPLKVKVARTTAIEGENIEFPLVFRWDEQDQKLEKGKFYTFIFWKDDGSEKIVFNSRHIEQNNDTFQATE
ncbi:hypothetical protein [Mesomycoplasma hyopneumoniae]|uniref:hypothetical protein n=1 Tax=Mesomycoplasma hyopneumoniae TaxID=2099 RepID=UPI00136EED98|nr:hypothetical protein [Mesomycoplasma hyopneumoniae]MXR10648.1 hypothetical protein [Mesomycoplasma hyopneumoniae]MXR63738.1 hypothetical protein [Mesomycoplasma hyopneumoniae]